LAKGGNRKTEKLLTAEIAEKSRRVRRENFSRSIDFKDLNYKKSVRIRAIRG
jgi:hypothetical protein